MTLPGWIQAGLRHFQREPWWAEVWSGVAALSVAVWAATQGAGVLFVLAGDLEVTARPLSSSELALWQVSGAALGTAQLAFLLWNNRVARWIVCACAAWWWCFLLSAMASWEPGALLLPLVGVHAATNLVGVVRLLREFPEV